MKNLNRCHAICMLVAADVSTIGKVFTNSTPSKQHSQWSSAIERKEPTFHHVINSEYFGRNYTISSNAINFAATEKSLNALQCLSVLNFFEQMDRITKKSPIILMDKLVPPCDCEGYRKQ